MSTEPIAASPPFRAVSQLVSRPVPWLWPGRLALGKLAILDGDPGLGKSLVTLDLCARLSTGRPFPDGVTGSGSANSLVLNGEDAAEDTLRPRLQALAADLERIFVLPGDDPDSGGPLSLATLPGVLDRALRQTRARLAVIDPVMAFLPPRVSVGDDAAVRRLLLPLARLAERHACALVLVRHLTKRGGSVSVYRGGGSIAFIGACRSGWLIARAPDSSGRCVLAQVKNNLAPPQASLTYRVTAAAGTVPVLEWLGPAAWTADQLLKSSGREGPFAGPRDRARDFLEGFLEDGPRTSREIWAAAELQELTDGTLRRAKRELRIRSRRVWADGQRLSYWLLPGQQLPDGVPPETAPPDLEPWLAPLREQFPPPTPLDEM